jgi:hypothetical protein
LLVVELHALRGDAGGDVDEQRALAQAGVAVEHRQHAERIPTGTSHSTGFGSTSLISRLCKCGRGSSRGYRGKSGRFLALRSKLLTDKRLAVFQSISDRSVFWLHFAIAFWIMNTVFPAWKEAHHEQPFRHVGLGGFDR